MQPIVLVDGVVRFQKNAVVRFLLDNGPFDMNFLACQSFSNGDLEQFAQLIGYSVSGYGELPYVRPEVVRAADRIAENVSRAAL